MSKTMYKDFDSWNFLKKNLDRRKNIPSFKQREVWWCHIGLNIGDEENGKNNNYHRPVLIIKKFNNHIFLGVPLTSRVKENRYYHKIYFHKNEQCAMISQFRILDCKRLDRRMGKIADQYFITIREELRKLI